MEVHPYRDPDDEILADFVEVVAQDDGMLVVRPEVKLESVGPRSETIKSIARQHMDLLGLRGPTGARHVRMPIDQPLFPTLPQVTDINQRSLGDCWFLAALAAIVAMGSGEAIKLMMRSVAVDNRKRPRDDPGREATHAVVRLYDEQRMEPLPARGEEPGRNRRAGQDLPLQRPAVGGHAGEGHDGHRHQ